MKALRKLLKWPLRAALRNDWLRAKVAFELRQEYFRDLQIEIPLSHGCKCPIRRNDYSYSFSEVFVAGEYGDFLALMPLPRRWIDLGCHAGFFSAYLAWQWRQRGARDFSALLVDADPRVRPDVGHLIELNQLQENFLFQAGLIKTGAGEVPFGLRDGMGSSFELTTRADEVASVPVLSSGEMQKIFPPPYDLLKLDVEGAEFDFVESYSDVLAEAKFAIIEWHSWDDQGLGEPRLQESMTRRGFEFGATLQPPKKHLVEGKPLSAGCHLYRNLKQTLGCAA